MAIRYYDPIAHHAMRQPEKLAAVDLAEGRRLSYRSFDDRIARLATGLQACGVTPGERVAGLAPNGTDTFEVLFACGRIGAIFVPLNWRLATPELAAILVDCAPRVLVYDADFADRAQALAEAGGVAHSLTRGGVDSPYEHAIATAERLQETVPATLDDVATILYTSGTTGRPKGAVVTHGMNLWNAVNGAPLARLTPETVFLTVLPLFHTGGLNVFAWPAFHVGGSVVVMRAFDAGEALRLIADPATAVTHLFGVPANFQFMMQHKLFAETDVARLAYAGVGGAPTPDAILAGWAARGLVLQQAYGMTETGPLVMMLDAADAERKAGSAGKPVLAVEVRLVGADGTPAGAGEVGELWVRGPAITPGYWRQEAATRAAIADGWLRTGDAAVVDAEGFYTIVDRWKDMYISGGENVYPAEVENVLYQIEAVAEAAVIGVPDARWGEVGRAVVVVREGHVLTEGAVISHCAAALARFKLPHSVVFTDALPRNATGKVHKPTLRSVFGT